MDRSLFIINEDSEHNEATSKEARSILNKKYSNFNNELSFEQFSEQKQKNMFFKRVQCSADPLSVRMRLNDTAIIAYIEQTSHYEDSLIE